MKARDQIKSSLAAVSLIILNMVIANFNLSHVQVEDLPSSGSPIPSNVTIRLKQLEQENKDLKKVTDDLRSLVLSLESRVKSLENSKPGAAVQAPKPSAPQPAPPAKAPAKPDDDDDDVDLFGSDEEDEDAERIKQERVAAYAAKKSTSNKIIYFLIVCSY